MVVVFPVCSQTMSRLFHKGEELGERNREGAYSPPGRESVRKCADLEGKQKEERPFS
jgi:hypothetical protein